MHCPDCGYDLTGNVSLRCPECGLAFELAAIENIVTDYFVDQRAALRRVTAFSVAAAVLALLLVALRSFPAGALLVIVGMTALTAAMTVRAYVASRWACLAIPPIGVLCSWLLIAHPPAFLLFTWCLVGVVLVEWLRQDRRFKYAEAGLDDDQGATLRGLRRASLVTLTAAVVASIWATAI